MAKEMFDFVIRFLLVELNGWSIPFDYILSFLNFHRTCIIVMVFSFILIHTQYVRIAFGNDMFLNFLTLPI